MSEVDDMLPKSLHTSLKCTRHARIVVPTIQSITPLWYLLSFNDLNWDVIEILVTTLIQLLFLHRNPSEFL